MNAIAETKTRQVICSIDDLITNSGICALVNDTEQVAIFYLPKEEPSVYALGNWDPIGKANVMSRGILGDIDGNLVVASPLYKQHFDLLTGQCVEDEEASLPVYDISIDGNKVVINA